MKQFLFGLFLVSGVLGFAIPVFAGFPCILTCPADQTVSNAPGECSQIVNYPAPTDNGGICQVVTCDPASGSSFPVNVPPDTGTTVTCTSTAGPTCSFLVTVTDEEPPVIDCPADINETVDGPTTETFTANVTDNCPGVTSSCDPASGSTFSIGTTSVDCHAEDTSGLIAVCDFLVDLTESAPPPPPPTGQINGGGFGCSLNPARSNPLSGSWRELTRHLAMR